MSQYLLTMNCLRPPFRKRQTGAWQPRRLRACTVWAGSQSQAPNTREAVRLTLSPEGRITVRVTTSRTPPKRAPGTVSR